MASWVASASWVAEDTEASVAFAGTVAGCCASFLVASTKAWELAAEEACKQASVA